MVPTMPLAERPDFARLLEAPPGELPDGLQHPEPQRPVGHLAAPHEAVVDERAESLEHVDIIAAADRLCGVQCPPAYEDRQSRNSRCSSGSSISWLQRIVPSSVR